MNERGEIPIQAPSLSASEGVCKWWSEIDGNDYCSFRIKGRKYGECGCCGSEACCQTGGYEEDEG